MRIGLTAGLILSAGCSPTFFAVPRYTTSPENVMVLHSLHAPSVNVGSFSAVEEATSLGCRTAGRVTTGDGEPFSQYVRSAFIAELQAAALYEPTATVTLSGALEDADFYSASRRWDLKLTVSSSNGRRLHIEGSSRWHETDLSTLEEGCEQAARAFIPAVQDMISRIVNDPSFPALLLAPETGPRQAPPAPMPAAASTNAATTP